MTGARPARPDRGIRRRRAVYLGAVALVAGAIAHLASVLALPYRSNGDAYAKVSAFAHGQRLLTVSESPSGSSVFPDHDPAVATAFCLYDLRAGPVRVSLDVGDADELALSMHGRHGVAFYGLTNRSASHGGLAVTLMTPEQLAGARMSGTSEDPAGDLRVAAPEPEGFAAASVLATAPSAAPAALDRARRLVCGPVKP